MKKEFEKWNTEKKTIDARDTITFFINHREVWFVKMGVNIWFEENGKDQFLRPVLVLKKVWNLFLTVALTSKWKDQHTFYHKFSTIQLHNPKYQESSFAILSQIKVMDKRRFFENAWIVWKEEFQDIQKKLRKIHF